MFTHYQNHKTSVNKNDHSQLVAAHFNENGPSFKNMKVICVKILPDIALFIIMPQKKGELRSWIYVIVPCMPNITDISHTMTL